MTDHNPNCDVYGSAVDAVREHLRNEGASLCTLLEALEDHSAIDAFLDLNTEFGKRDPDVPAIQRALLAIADRLGSQSFEHLDLLARIMNSPTSDAIRWHGAKVSDLVARFH